MERKEIIHKINQCGHYLHYRRGKRIGQYKILAFLMDNDGIPQKELQEILRVKSGSISEIINKVESSGWVVRIRDEKDKRRVLLKMTDDGRKKFLDEIEKYKDDEAKLLDSLSDEECEKLYSLLNKLCNSWEIDEFKPGR